MSAGRDKHFPRGNGRQIDQKKLISGLSYWKMIIKKVLSGSKNLFSLSGADKKFNDGEEWEEKE